MVARRVADGLAARFPAVADLLTEAEPDLLVHFTFPEAHRPRIRSTNPQERLNKSASVSPGYGIMPLVANEAGTPSCPMPMHESGPATGKFVPPQPVCPPTYQQTVSVSVTVEYRVA